MKPNPLKGIKKTFMCFSSQASIGAGIVLSISAIATLKKTTDPKMRMFAAIPLVFGIQQFVEGYLWLQLSLGIFSQKIESTAYLFLLFAQVVWPVWVPLSMALPEQNTKRKKILYGIVVVGTVSSCYTLFYLSTHAIQASISGFHIVYQVPYPEKIVLIGGLLYFICTIVPSFVSSIKHMWSIGAVLFLSYLIAKVFYNEYLVSVWCFFAALLSVLIYFVLVVVHKTSAEAKTVYGK